MSILQILPVAQAHVEVLDQIASMYENLNLCEEGADLIDRTYVPGLCADYNVSQNLLDDLQVANPSFKVSNLYHGFNVYVEERRRSYQQMEMGRLHDKFVENDGRALMSGALLSETVAAIKAGQRIVEGGCLVSSPYFGDINPRILNDSIDRFKGELGQAQFLAALSVLMGDTAWDLGSVPLPTIQKLDWRRSYDDWPRLLIQTQAAEGEESAAQEDSYLEGCIDSAARSFIAKPQLFGQDLMLGGGGFSSTQWKVLLCLVEKNECPCTLADKTGIGMTSIYTVIKRLVRKGAIEKVNDKFIPKSRGRGWAMYRLTPETKQVVISGVANLLMAVDEIVRQTLIRDID